MAGKESPKMTNSIPYLDQALRLNEALLGLPALPLLFIGCLAFGYLLKTVPFYKNRWIPFSNFCFGILGNLCLSGVSNRYEIAKSVILGIVAAGSAWYVHRKWLSKIIDERYFQPGDTEQLTKPDK